MTQLQVGRSLDRTERNHDTTATLGDCSDGKPALLRLEELDIIGIHRVSDTQVVCTVHLSKREREAAGERQNY